MGWIWQMKQIYHWWAKAYAWFLWLSFNPLFSSKYTLRSTSPSLNWFIWTFTLKKYWGITENNSLHLNSFLWPLWNFSSSWEEKFVACSQDCTFWAVDNCRNFQMTFASTFVMLSTYHLLSSKENSHTLLVFLGLANLISAAHVQVKGDVRILTEWLLTINRWIESQLRHV